MDKKSLEINKCKEVRTDKILARVFLITNTINFGEKTSKIQKAKKLNEIVQIHPVDRYCDCSVTLFKVQKSVMETTTNTIVVA